jgi:hypothetical protein
LCYGGERRRHCRYAEQSDNDPASCEVVTGNEGAAEGIIAATGSTETGCEGARTELNWLWRDLMDRHETYSKQESILITAFDKRHLTGLVPSRWRKQASIKLH